MKYLALVPMAAGLLLLNNIDAMARVLNEKVAEVIQQPTALATTTVSKMEAANPLPPEKDKIYDTCDIMPEFPGGQNALLQFLAKNIKYPTEAQQQGKQGKVVVTFVIEKDGSITNAKVTQALYPSLDEESLRIVKSMPKWTPGKMKDGKVVRVQYTDCSSLTVFPFLSRTQKRHAIFKNAARRYTKITCPTLLSKREMFL